MSVRIAVLNPAAERDLEDAAALMTSYWREVLGEDEPATTTAEIRDRLLLDIADTDITLLIARAGDRAVGMSCTSIQTGRGNEHMAWTEDLYVVGDQRRAGTGRRLLEETIAVARAAGRTLLIGAYHEESDDGASFARAMATRLANRERQNRVRVADLDRTLLESWSRAAPGYSLVQFDGRCPDDLLDAYVRIYAVMNDAPRTESLGDFHLTAEHRRDYEAAFAKAGVAHWFVGARHDATGDLAGFTEMTIRPFKAWLVEQEDTAVHPDHRGKSIGRWLKAVNALRVLDERVDATHIQTWNDGSNKWMLAINTEMGFRPVATWIEAELDLSV